MRINARLDEERARKLELLKRVTHTTTSDILKQAIDLYYEQVQAGQPKAYEVLAQSGFIGSGSASAQLSESYKAALPAALRRKA